MSAPTKKDPESELEMRRAAALAMGSRKRLAERREKGILNARERLDYLLDKDSFLEVGLLARSNRETFFISIPTMTRPWRRTW